MLSAVIMALFEFKFTKSLKAKNKPKLSIIINYTSNREFEE